MWRPELLPPPLKVSYAPEQHKVKMEARKSEIWPNILTKGRSSRVWDESESSRTREKILCLGKKGKSSHIFERPGWLCNFCTQVIQEFFLPSETSEHLKKRKTASVNDLLLNSLVVFISVQSSPSDKNQMGRDCTVSDERERLATEKRSKTTTDEQVCFSCCWRDCGIFIQFQDPTRRFISSVRLLHIDIFRNSRSHSAG